MGNGQRARGSISKDAGERRIPENRIEACGLIPENRRSSTVPCGERGMIEGEAGMGQLRKLVTFNLNSERFALHVSNVERIVRVVEITPLPGAPRIVLGIVNFQGRIVPVLDIRARLGLRAKPVELGDLMVLASTKKRAVSFLIDSVEDVIEIPEEKIIPAREILPEVEVMEGVVKTEEGLILLQDLDAFLSFREEDLLRGALDAWDDNDEL